MVARTLRLNKHAQPSLKLQEYFSVQWWVSGSFRTRADGRTTGLVTGLAKRRNYLVRRVSGRPRNFYTTPME
jgi:hypothetical protein